MPSTPSNSSTPQLSTRPKVGIGVIIENRDGQILVGKRKGSHAPFYSIPGGHIELGETFEAAAIKEVEEETGLLIKNPQVFSVCNNLRTFAQEQVHSISINLYVNQFEGQVTLREKDKCEGWFWMKPTAIPQPHFDASEFAIECYLKQQFYIPNQI